jgi:hypothetical protein
MAEPLNATTDRAVLLRIVHHMLENALEAEGTDGLSVHTAGNITIF